MQNNRTKITPEETIKSVSRELGFGKDVLILDLVGGCGVANQLTGNLWRVIEPATGQAFIICLAQTIRENEIQALGLNKEIPFVCYEATLNEDTREYILNQTTLIPIKP